MRIANQFEYLIGKMSVDAEDLSEFPLTWATLACYEETVKYYFERCVDDVEVWAMVYNFTSLKDPRRQY